MKKTVIIGASEYPFRYSYKAAHMLNEHAIEFVMIGKREGKLLQRKIMSIKEKPEVGNVHTITLYINPQNQKKWYDYILDLSPVRIIFNPGTENYEFAEMASKKNIQVVEACTLVMLQTGQY